MQCTRRQAMPLRVHQIWDAVGRFSSTQVMDFEKLIEVVSSMHKMPKDELNKELECAIKDGLITNDVVETQKREESEVYKLPDVTSFEKGDHDWYCFHCHLGGSVVNCEDCPRVYHLDCLPEDRKPDKDLFVCPACHIVATKPSVDKIIGLKQKQLNQLIGFICDRFSTWSVEWMEHSDGAQWAVACHRSEKEAWRLKVLVYLPMDLSTMRDKALQGKYVSLEEFQVDCETFVHAIGVYFGLDALKGSQLGAAFYREALHDIQEIKLCHQCFRRSNEKDHDWWFCLPCTPGHEVVWAKQSGYPYWPAKVMKKEGNKYDVRYFGGNYERGNIDAKNIQKIETPLTTLRVRRTAGWNDAYEELQKFQELAKDPAAVSELPSRGKGGGGSAKKDKASVKRTSNSSTPEAPPKKVRKSEPPAASTPPKAAPKKTGVSVSAKAVLKSKESPKANGTPLSTQASKKKPLTNANAARRDSPAKEGSTVSNPVKRKRSGGSSKLPHQPHGITLDESVDPELRSILTDVGTEEGTGDAYFSDEDSAEPSDKVSEDAVSSSCNEGKSTRNAYVHISHPGCVEVNAERIVNYVNTLKEQHKQEIDTNKKKQWCYNCGREAIYHCCWNTAYCSIECQQQHWTSEHKRQCRRERH